MKLASARQVVLTTIVGLGLNAPFMFWAVSHADEDPPRAALLGLLNMAVGVSLLILIIKKWISKVK